MIDNSVVKGSIRIVFTTLTGEKEEVWERRFPEGTPVRGVHCVRCGASQIVNQQEFDSLIAMMKYLATNENRNPEEEKLPSAMTIYAASLHEFTKSIEALFRLFNPPD
jgi:hypothetical protein